MALMRLLLKTQKAYRSVLRSTLNEVENLAQARGIPIEMFLIALNYFLLRQTHFSIAGGIAGRLEVNVRDSFGGESLGERLFRKSRFVAPRCFAHVDYYRD